MGEPRLILLFGLAIAACGAGEESQPVVAAPGPERLEPADEASDPGVATPDPEPAPEPEPEAPPPPEPVVLEAGVRMGPIQIGMSQADLDALGLQTSDADPRSRRYGPYRVWVRNGTVERVEAEIGHLERIQLGDRTFEAGVDIYTLRDAFPDCVWVEGGGERYRCADGRLTVRTTHTMDPRRYTLGVRSR